ncbi:MAG: DinB family protein [Candidatus Hydrogenedentes bacterium]|nr:DinB family protein [Candidatus Hydrogenedentota bacterium]
MGMIDAIAQEFGYEAGLTRKMLDRVPEDKLGWKPHEKSMSLGRLAGHIAEIPGYMVVTLSTDELVIDPKSYKPEVATSRSGLLAGFDRRVAEAKSVMEGQTNDHLMLPWRLKMGDRVVFELPRVAVIRSMVLNHTVHHRGQLSVYLRLQGVPVPAIYGPSADEAGM